jgi:hypothetical protein
MVARQTNNLQALSLTSSELAINEKGEISIYNGELTTQCIVNSVATIKKSFPVLTIDFFDVLTDRLKANNFSDDRLKDAISHVIDTCIYPAPTIAQFISFDKKYKVFTYEQMLKKWDDGIGDSYRAVKLPERERPVWIHVDDINMAKLNEFIIK